MNNNDPSPNKTPPIVLVTGASRGIGAAIAARFAETGHTVIGTATRQAGADRITNTLRALQSASYGVALDVTKHTQTKAVYDTICRETGAPLILVNNAGITRDNLFMRMNMADWDAVVATNLSAAAHLSQVAMRAMMKARFGRIMNIGSVIGAMGNAGQANYAAAKAGLEGFSRALAREVGSRNITVNTIAPGFIQTDMTDKLSDDMKATLTAQIPMQRLGTPQDIANMAWALATFGDYITGQTLHVNGGMLMPS